MIQLVRDVRVLRRYQGWRRALAWAVHDTWIRIRWHHGTPPPRPRRPRHRHERTTRMSELTADEVAKIERALRARAARDWPPFDPDAKCPKCSYDDIGSMYHDGWVYRFPRSGDAEWIERVCRRCHYCWPEECTAAEPATRPDGR